VEQIAHAVLYEGYILYPYRPGSVKNRQRFNFGVLYPREYCDLQAGSEAWEMRTEIPVVGSAVTTIEAKVRFLRLSAREDWQEGHERDVCTPPVTLASILTEPHREAFAEGEWELKASRSAEGVFRVTLSIRNLMRPENTAASRDEVLLQSMISVHSILQVTDGEFVSLLDPPEQYRAAAAECRNSGMWPVLA
jgi:hydrogenase maturation protease